MTNVENVSVEQVVDSYIGKKKNTSQKEEIDFFGFDNILPMGKEEMKNYLLDDVHIDGFNGKDDFGTKIAKLQNFLPTLIGKVKAMFNPEIQKLKAFLEENKNNALLLGKLKQEIENQKTLNIELAIQQVKSPSVEAVQSKPVLNQEVYPQFSGLYNFGGKQVAIQSYPFQRSSTGTTLCAKTARLNGKYFNLELPSGNAYNAGKILPTTTNYLLTLPERKKTLRPSSSRPTLTKYDFSNTSANFADIYTSSVSSYGHRAVAFRDSITGEWFTLDPYTKVDGVADSIPKPLEEYLEEKKIVKAHFYNSPGYEQYSQAA